MSFQRTPAGLSNLYLFLDVDLVIFVEGGGSSYSFAEIQAGKYNEQAPDIRFWEIMFEVFCAGRRCHFRAVGGKAVLLEMATQVQAGLLAHIAVCMDRDFDHLTGALIRTAGVLYTFGYSWENDVWTKPGMFAVYQQFSTLPKYAPDVQKEINEQFSSFEKSVYWAIHAWFLLLRDGTTHGVNWLRALRHKVGSPPAVDQSALRMIIKGAATGRAKGAAGGGAGRLRLRPQIDCSGHLLGAYCFHLVSYLVRKYCKIRVFPKDTAIPVAINTVSKEIPADPDRRAHYAAQFAGL